MRVVFQQADLDTCLTGAILGVAAGDDIVWRPHCATSEELADPAVICIEAGGSGQTESNNFDHHNTASLLAPACTQAFQSSGYPQAYARLVAFAEKADTGRLLTAPAFPNLSHLISGIRFLHAGDAPRQFIEGVCASRLAAELGLDPFLPLPWLDEWIPFLEEKKQRQQTAIAERPKLEHFGEWRLVFLESGAAGTSGRLYQIGADVAVVHLPSTGKFIISGNHVRVDGLLPMLNEVDPGWGGPCHGGIIGSPRSGSRLDFRRLCAIVKRHLDRIVRVEKEHDEYPHQCA